MLEVAAAEADRGGDVTGMVIEGNHGAEGCEISYGITRNAHCWLRAFLTIVLLGNLVSATFLSPALTAEERRSA
jgi:hypothetical protein